MPTAANPVRFGAFEVDFRSGELRKNGMKVRLADQPLQILALLLEHPGQVVTRDELHQRLWSSDTFVDFEHGLNAAVKRLREALGDSADSPRFIETLPRHGYRFIAPVNGTEPSVSPPEATPRKRRAWKMYALSAAALLLVVAVTFYYLHRKPPLTEKDSILLADFVNTTGEPVFDDTLKQALATQLEQSPYLNLVPEPNVRETLKYMGRTPDERLTESVAREVCQRENIKAMLTGSIARLGNQYVIALHAINCQTGESLAREQTTAEAKEKVLPAVSTISTHLRKQLGESLPSIQKYDKPFEEATTASLDALQAFSRGRELLFKGQQLDGLTFFQRAVELDPDFALAHASMAQVFANLHQETRSMDSMQKAFALRDRVSEREKFVITMFYHWVVTGDMDKEMETQLLYHQAYARDPLPLNDLALAYSWYLGEPEKAIEAGNRLSQLSPHFFGADVALAIGYIALGRLDEAQRALDSGLQRSPDNGATRNWLFVTESLRNDQVRMKRELEWAAGKVEASGLTGKFAAAAMARLGRLKVARELAAQGIETARAHGFRDLAAELDARQALTEAEFGNIQQGREMAIASGSLSRTRMNLPIVAVAFAMTGDSAKSQQILDDLVRRFPSDTNVNSIFGPCARALFNYGEPSKGVEGLQASRRFELGTHTRFLPIYVRGLTYLRAGQPTLAAAEFQRIIDHRGYAPIAPEYALAHVGLARAYAMAGDTARSRQAYEDFFALWKDADSDIPILREAQAEYLKMK